MLSARNGFTLLELLAAVAIVGILVAIAIPSYRSHIDKANNSQAIADILEMQLCLERFFTVNFKYPLSDDEVTTCVPGSKLDPWGNAYVYLNIINGGPGIKGKVRKDHKLNPINTNFDLYSMGKNGQSKTQVSQKDSVDDIILARDGSFVGVAADF